MNELLKIVSDKIYDLTDEEQNEFILTLVKGIQKKRRDKVEAEQATIDHIQKNFETLKESLCNASNLMK